MNFLRTTKLRQGKTVRNIKSSLVIPRLSVVENITFILSILLLFMQPLKNAISIFSYIDEFAVLFSFMAFAYTVIRRRSISTIEGKIIASFLLFIIVGLFGNTLSKVDRSTAAILTDVLSYGKFFMMIIGGVALFDSLKNSKWIFSIWLMRLLFRQQRTTGSHSADRCGIPTVKRQNTQWTVWRTFSDRHGLEC